MNRIASFGLVAALSAGPLLAGQPAAEKEVWSLEDSYWKYVQANDLEGYRTLWHEDFLGWPLSSPEPVHKAHITDWITAHTSSGETLRSYSLERLEAQATANYVTVTYRVRLNWVDKAGVEKPGSLRVIHTWLGSVGHKWQIISGMAAAPNAQGH
ncbi:MAG: nuclear transport factor 2 family protein [Gammaproteobacteria bacterium]|nr:nuclear transport factor 2 family protein [Gammaproteobacteria bacterium]MBV8307104.1 nuclear transport factor 2 family protein [Gammaproteobacteria bacterium]MBV8402789.1 nuclear transport factor 2 family protein [Gammaproteobacteria bacterium]